MNLLKLTKTYSKCYDTFLPLLHCYMMEYLSGASGKVRIKNKYPLKLLSLLHDTDLYIESCGIYYKPELSDYIPGKSVICP